MGDGGMAGATMTAGGGGNKDIEDRCSGDDKG